MSHNKLYLDNKKQKEISGVLESYQNFLSSPEWKEYRLEVIRTFGGKCWFCGSTHDLVVHHVKYNRRNLLVRGTMNPARVRWLLVVCSHCHKEIHFIQKMQSVSVLEATNRYRQKYFPAVHAFITREEIQTNRGA